MITSIGKKGGRARYSTNYFYRQKGRACTVFNYKL